MDLQAYFDRIGYVDGGSDTERLIRLHRAHITHIPFEDIDVYNGKILDITPAGLEKKLVAEHRGGYCFEMNGLFCEEAKAMGIDIYGVLARVASAPGTFGAHNHRMNLATVDGTRYVCDVGFGGDCFVDPLKLELGLEQETHGAVYRIVAGERVQYSVQILKNGEFTDLLGFDDIRAIPEDFEVSNFYTNCSPASGFKNFLMLNRFTETGRYSMFNLALTVTEGEKRETRSVTMEELPEVLKTFFGLDVMPNRAPAFFPPQR